jgi:hypothetical protein
VRANETFPMTDDKIKEVRFRDLVDLPSTTYGTFGLYRYPAKFIPHVVAYIIENYAEPGMTIFDPFAGYGTVGVVSRIYGHDYELWDLNPLLEILHAITTQKPRDIDITALIERMKQSKEDFTPGWSNFDYWFHEEFIPLLAKVWGFYHLINDEYTKLLLTIPLLKVSRLYSYDDMGRMKLSKSPKSVQRIQGLLDTDWENQFFELLKSEVLRISRSLAEYQQLSPKSTKSVIQAGIDSLTFALETDRDILLTSPPYLQSQEYIRHAKMDLFWLGIPEHKIKELRKLEIPYRDVPEVEVHSNTYSSLKKTIDEEHMRRIFERYFWAIIRSLSRLQERIKSFIFIFVGRASLRGKSIPIDKILAEHLVEIGWIHEATLVDKITSRRMFAYGANPATGIIDRRTKTENLVILKRT